MMQWMEMCAEQSDSSTYRPQVGSIEHVKNLNLHLRIVVQLLPTYVIVGDQNIFL